MTVLDVTHSHVTSGTTVKIDWIMLWNYKNPKRCIVLVNYSPSCIYSSTKQYLTVVTLNDSFRCAFQSRDTCHNCQNCFFLQYSSQFPLIKIIQTLSG